MCRLCVYCVLFSAVQEYNISLSEEVFSRAQNLPCSAQHYWFITLQRGLFSFVSLSDLQTEQIIEALSPLLEVKRIEARSLSNATTRSPASCRCRVAWWKKNRGGLWAAGSRDRGKWLCCESVADSPRESSAAFWCNKLNRWGISSKWSLEHICTFKLLLGYGCRSLHHILPNMLLDCGCRCLHTLRQLETALSVMI